ncbi:MAG: DUF169 domain-containing protein [bacterium]
MTENLPDPTILLKRTDITEPLIGFYNAPEAEAFAPLIIPEKGECVFDYFDRILAGETLHLSKEHYGCPGAGRSICGVETFSTEGLVKFLVETEGLKASKELMEGWVEKRKPYKGKFPNVLIGPYRPELWEYLVTITFTVNPDQLSALTTGAQYNASPDDPEPTIVRFGSGCSLLVPFENFEIAQAAIGATDMAMRSHLKADRLLYTVTKPMFERLCKLDEKSFLFKRFRAELRKSRGLTDLT